ncbi:hypothetical protein Btru_059030 [Bulinus truncatus]|nr:hypothetical protein Btru_059030 [Bulinus truncatus]
MLSQSDEENDLECGPHFSKLQMTHRNQNRKESLRVTDQSDDREESLRVTDQSDDREESLRVTDQSDATSTNSFECDSLHCPPQILNTNEISSNGSVSVLRVDAEAARVVHHLSETIPCDTSLATLQESEADSGRADKDASGTEMESLLDNAQMPSLSKKEDDLECAPILSRLQKTDKIKGKKLHQVPGQSEVMSADPRAADSFHPDSQRRILSCSDINPSGNVLGHSQAQSLDKVEVFFTEASFYKYLPRPKFEDRLPQWLSRFPIKKPKPKDLDKPKKSKCSSEDSFHDQIEILKEQVSLKRRSSCESSKDMSSDHASSFECNSSPEDNTARHDSVVDKDNCEKVTVIEKNNCESKEDYPDVGERRPDVPFKDTKSIAGVLECTTVLEQSQPVQHDNPEVSHDMQHLSQTVHDLPEVSHDVQHLSQTVHDLPEVSHDVQHLSQTVHDNPEVSHDVQHLSQTVHDSPEVAGDVLHPQEIVGNSMTLTQKVTAEESKKEREPREVADQSDVVSADSSATDTSHSVSQQLILNCIEIHSNERELVKPEMSQQQCTFDSQNYLSEHDIPIFSVKEVVPPPSDSAGDVQVNPVKKNSIWAGETKTECSANDSKQLLQSNPVSNEPNSTGNSSFQRSDLTMEEHATYLKLYNKYVSPFLHTRPPQIYGEQQILELSHLQSLQRRVMNEQQAFQKYLYGLALKSPKGYGFLKAGARHYSSNKACAYHLKKSYEQKFSPAARCHIPLVSRSPGAELAFCQTLLEVGVPPRIVLPDIQSGKKPVPIPHDVKKLDYLFPRISNKTFPGYIHHEPVSLDGNMKALLIKYGAQVAMSSSVVNCLFNNHGPEYARTWNIPVTVEMCQSGGFSFKVVYLDKPLFEEDLVIRDYSALFHKYAFRSFVTHPNKRTRSVSKVAMLNVQGSEKSYDDTFDIFSSSADSLETFGTSFSQSISKVPSSKEAAQQSSSIYGASFEPAVKRSKTEVKQGESLEAAVTSKLAGALDSSGGGPELRSPSSPLQSPIASPPLYPVSRLPHESHTIREIPLSPIKSDQVQSSNCSPVTSSPKTTGTFRRPNRGLLRTRSHDPKSAISVITTPLLSPLDSILGHPIRSTRPNVEPTREDPSLYMPPTEDCSSLLYNLFTIGGKQVLIRCRSHGILNDRKKSRPVYILPKMEYQTNFGYEQVTHKEAIKSWTACYIRHQTNLLRVRINSFSSEVLMYEELEPHQILTAAVNFQPQDAFQFLDSILNHLTSLDCGKYLLSHEGGSDFCALRCQKPVVSQDQRETEPITVKKIKNDNTVPWIPIDPTLLTQHHIANNRIPATFLPKDFVIGGKQTNKKHKKNKSNKGKKRKAQNMQNGENYKRNDRKKNNRKKNENSILLM